MSDDLRTRIAAVITELLGALAQARDEDDADE